jgi:hypothetical protein
MPITQLLWELTTAYTGVMGSRSLNLKMPFPSTKEIEHFGRDKAMELSAMERAYTLSRKQFATYLPLVPNSPLPPLDATLASSLNPSRMFLPPAYGNTPWAELDPTLMRHNIACDPRTFHAIF